jgi:DNA transformation protein
MFGGVGLYCGGVMFALIDDEVIFLKTDETLRAALREQGSRAWVYTRARGEEAWPQETSYWSLPKAAWDDPEEAVRWGRRALEVAQAIRAAKPPPRSRTAAPRRVSAPKARRR